MWAAGATMAAIGVPLLGLGIYLVATAHTRIDGQRALSAVVASIGRDATGRGTVVSAGVTF
jgi:hypothetical protein